MLGTVGSYAIASPWKFFPVRDGGVLRDNVAGSQMRRNAQSWLAEASALAVTLQGGWRHGRGGDALPIIEPAALCEQAGLIAARGGRQLDVPGFKEFSVERAALSSLRLSRWGVRHATHERIARRRRAHFLRWLEGVRGLPSVQPLYPDLPEGVVPYAFPLLIDEDAMCFHLLKLAGIPLWRWEDMAVTDCDVSRDYRLRLLQLPCHQELKSEQLDWMIRAVQLLSHRL